MISMFYRRINTRISEQTLHNSQIHRILPCDLLQHESKHFRLSVRAYRIYDSHPNIQLCPCQTNHNLLLCVSIRVLATNFVVIRKKNQFNRLAKGFECALTVLELRQHADSMHVELLPGAY